MKMIRFDQAFQDVTKDVTKIPRKEYLSHGRYPIVDQGDGKIAGYTNRNDGLYTDVPVVLFGDHTRVFKYVDFPFFAGADGTKILKARSGIDAHFGYYSFMQYPLISLGYSRHFKLLKERTFHTFDYATQLRIAGVLGSIDEKIELNRKKIAELEALAKTIYDYWFVQFDFPDKNGKPYKSSGGKMVWNEQLKREVPEGWKAGTVGNFVEIHRGASPRPIQDFLSNNGLRWLKISDATNSTSPFIMDIEDHIRKEGLSKTVALKAGDLVLSNSASPGIPKFLGVNSCIHDGWLYFPQSKVSYEFLFLFLDKIKPSLIPQGNGSVFKNLKTDILKLFPMLKPPTTVLSLFDDMIKPIFMDIRTVVVATKETTILRDTLLPLLMNGQAEVAG